MKRITTAVLLSATLTAGVAYAQPQGAASGQIPGAGLVAGGGNALMTGSGDDMRITYAAGGAGRGGVGSEQSGRTTTFTGSDGDGRPHFASTLPSTAPGVGREAWLSGSGDEAQVTYIRPR